jgi:hypothetical protein
MRPRVLQCPSLLAGGVAFPEIQTVERRQFSAPRTAGLVVGGVLAALLALAFAMVAAWGSAWSSG